MWRRLTQHFSVSNWSMCSLSRQPLHRKRRWVSLAVILELIQLQFTVFALLLEVWSLLSFYILHNKNNLQLL
jgi:hypothetical protein